MSGNNYYESEACLDEACKEARRCLRRGGTCRSTVLRGKVPGVDYRWCDIEGGWCFVTECLPARMADRCIASQKVKP